MRPEATTRNVEVFLFRIEQGTGYYDDGREHTAIDPLGHTTTYNYDVAGRMTSAVDAQGHTTQYGYDDAGNQVSATDPNGHTTQSQYDCRRRLLKTIYPDATTTLYAYDGPGNLASVTDQAGNVVQYSYDAANQLRSVVQVNHPDPSRNTTAYGYDSDGNQTATADANSHTTQSGFDILDQLKTETLADGALTETRNYDAAGNLVSLLDFNGKTTTYTYDSLNRLLARTPDPSLGEPAVSFTYTPTGKRATMTDASGTTSYTYDNLDRLTTKATPQGTLNYTYDAAGNLASMSANGYAVAYTYDGLNRLSSVVSGANTTTYTYDPASNLGTVTYPNGLSSTFQYDDLNRLKAVNGYTYQFGPTGNRQQATEPNGRTINWAYDGIYRLANETISLDPRSHNGSVYYGLDPVGNRLSQTSTLSGIQNATFAYDSNDRILSTEQYDNNGNTTTSGARTFAYDFENRLKSMNSGAMRIIYDGDGNRVAKTIGGVTTQYLVDDLNPTGYAQVVEELVGGAVQRTYTYGRQRISQNQSGAITYYGYDGLGSVRALADGSGTVTDTYDYDAWGNIVNQTGNTPNVYLYRGEQYDPDLGLYYLRARYFNPLTGRFLTRDAAESVLKDPATLHRYLYAGGSPVDRMDPSGTQAGSSPDPYSPSLPFLPPMPPYFPPTPKPPSIPQESPLGGLLIYDPFYGGASGYVAYRPGLRTIHITLFRPACQWSTDPGGGGPTWIPPQGGNPGPTSPGSGAGGGDKGGIQICSRAGQQEHVPGGIGNHTYLWDNRKNRSCGWGNSIAGNEKPNAPGTHCDPVPGSVGKEDQIMNCCTGTVKDTTWVAFYHDCFNLVNECVSSAGLPPPPLPGWQWTGGRIGPRCPQPECLPGPWIPYPSGLGLSTMH